MRHARGIKLPSEIKRLPKSVKFISFLIFVYYIGWGIATPFLPIYIKELLGSFTALGLVVALLPLFSIIFNLSVGSFIDRISKRKIITLALFFYLPLSYIFLSLKILSHFIIFSMYNAFISTLLWLSSISYIREHTPKRKAALTIGLFDSSFGLSLVIGSVIGGLLISKYSFNIFYAISIFAFFALLLSFFIPEHKKTRFISAISLVIKKDKLLKGELINFKNNKPLVHLSFYTFLFYIVFSFTIMLVPLLLKELNASFLQIGLITAFFYLPLTFESYFSLIKNRKALINISLLTGIVLLVLVYKIDNLFYLFIVLFLLGLCNSALRPLIEGKVTELTPKKEIGEMTAVTRTIKEFAFVVGPLGAGIISDLVGIKLVFLIGSIIFIMLYTLHFREAIA